MSRRSRLELLSIAVLWLTSAACVGADEPRHEDTAPQHAMSFGRGLMPGGAVQIHGDRSASRPASEAQSLVAPTLSSLDFPQSGYKRVILVVRTGTATNDGTDDASQAYFEGQWVTNSGGFYQERFKLDHPDIDNLERGSINMLFYQFRLDSMVAGATQDTFVKGRIGNTSGDRWHCASIEVLETSSAGGGRSQWMAFNTSVEGGVDSTWMNAPNTSTLSYGTVSAPPGGGGGGGCVAPGCGCLLPGCETP